MKIIAHRGSSVRAPENTLAAIRAAIEDGADGIEVDAQLTRDGEVVLVHDYDLLRVAHDPRPVAHCTYLELAELDVGWCFDPKFKGERIPRLIEAIEVVRDRAFLDVELKAYTPRIDLADCVVDILRSADATAFCVLSVTSAELLAHLRACAPEISVGWVATAQQPALPELPGYEFVAVEENIVTDLVAELQRRCLPWWVWTINDPARARGIQTLGASALITDDPARIRAALA